MHVALVQISTDLEHLVRLEFIRMDAQRIGH
jgi:hypothetical protein